VSLRLGFSGEGFGYAIDLGLPVSQPGESGEEPRLALRGYEYLTVQP
jgi:hypothetical protein